MPATTNTDFNKALGQVVRARRIGLGMTQDALGKQIDVTFQQIQKYERGINRLAVEMLLQVAIALQTSAQQLIQSAQEIEAPSAETPTAMPDRMHMETMRYFARLPLSRQLVARNVIKALSVEEAA